MNYRYQNKKNSASIWLLLLLFSGLWSNYAISQITISTESGTNYNGLSGVATGSPAVPCAITFVIENTNAVPITLTQVFSYCKTTQDGTTQKLWYSTTSLSGPPTIATPDWTVIGTGSLLSIPANGYYPVVTGLSFIIPPGAQYRFALESSNGVSYTTSSANPSPNTITASGVNLKLYDAMINGDVVGFGGGFPMPANNPRGFTGRVVFTGITCNQPTAPVLSSDTAICSGDSAHLSITGGSLNSATDWKWYTTSCGGSLAGTGTSLAVLPTTTTTYYARGEGGCTTPGTCASVTVTVNPLPGVPTINPITPICNNSVQTLTINPIAITAGSVTVSSGAISVAVPDNIATGATSTLTIPALPAGATITGIDVRLNMTHTFIADMIFNLKAPNGQILALDKYITAGFPDGEDFVNTVISSAGTDDLSTGTAPFTGTFKPDAINTPFPMPIVVQNPAGFVSNAASFANLYSVPNGVWTLAMADGGPADLGTLNEWAITINYTVSATAYPAVWSPSSTLFSDPAATVPYDGTTPEFTVYAKPEITTTYTASSVINGCGSAASATATVIVNDTINITSQPGNSAVCEFGSTQFGVKVTGTTPAYQWLVDNGAGSYVPITDNTNYSGATTDTLTVKDIPISWNGFKYRVRALSQAPCAKFDTTAAALLRVYKTPSVSLSVSPYTKLLPGLITAIKVSSDSSVATYNWFRNDLAISTATGDSLSIAIDGLGSYKVNIIDLHGCSVTSAGLVITDSVSSNLFIFPNPNNGQFQVRYYSMAGNVLPRSLMIYDSKGALVLSKGFTVAKPYDQMDVDFSRLGSGVYIVNLLDLNGKRLAFGKVVVGK